MPLNTQGDVSGANIKPWWPLISSCRQAKEKANPWGLAWPSASASASAIRAYCISDITICDMLLLCLSIEVLACISICLEVMLAVSEA